MRASTSNPGAALPEDRRCQDLERCHQEHPMFQEVKPVTLWSRIKSFPLRLRDEQRRKLFSFGRLRAIGRAMCSPRTGS